MKSDEIYEIQGTCRAYFESKTLIVERFFRERLLTGRTSDILVAEELLQYHFVNVLED
jgi:hypothetical protein